MKTIALILGVVCGAFVGFVVGILGAMGLGIWAKWAYPTDPTAGSVAIIVIATAPCGAILGAVLGGGLVAKFRERRDDGG